ncbi:hypothetical protein RF11_12596 [Thelohanellus kitauei]|uniref:FLYWCH-type domain-containing protein n=1 Tax=Thelohanellus kitauei TaxID=669202 RepID=A0A0C2M6R1_THEKT|nr:hypothetical protein RF11_12596 [Thelohanellus kitauei]
MTDNIQFGIIKRGNLSVIYNGHEYWKYKETSPGRVTWRCIKLEVFKCKATLTTLNDTYLHQNFDHNHGGNLSTALARKAVGMMKLCFSPVPRYANTARTCSYGFYKESVTKPITT